MLVQRRDLPGGTVTLLFSDIAGSTRLLDELGPVPYEEALDRHREEIRAALGRHGGLEVDTQGDSFFAVFTTADRAVMAALEIQHALSNGPIRVRIGMHTGTPDVGREGYIGPDVHRGARIAAAAHGGQTILSTSTRHALTPDLFELLDLGEHRLKDFPTPAPLFQVGTTPSPPLRTISNTNLPRPASEFLGREREVADVREIVRGARFVTLTGPGGTGKTRLAIESAAELVGDFKAGVWWVALASLTDPGLVPDTIAAAIGAKDELATFIGAREMLLVLDNLEQVIDCAPFLAALVEACPNLRVIATSRERLRVRGEREYSVSPLSDTDAARLFSDRAQVSIDKVVEELCRRLDNLPLAIELASARTNVLSPEQILERLGQRLDLLRGGRGTVARQNTLRATIEWSYDLLDDAERQLFARSSVFAGGWALEAAEGVTSAEIGTLQSLVDKSLIVHADGRFRLLETVRQFAAERLSELPEAESQRERHADYYLALAVAAANLHELTSLTALAVENDNLRSALSWYVESDDREAGIRAIASLWRYWLACGMAAEGDRWAVRILDLSGRCADLEEGATLIYAGELARFGGNLARARMLKESGLPFIHDDNPDLFAAAAHDLGMIELGLGNLEAADRYTAEALDVRRSRGSPAGIAHALEGRAHVEWHLGHSERAIELLQEAVDLNGPTDSEFRAALLGSLGEYQRRVGMLEVAVVNASKALTLAVSVDDALAIAFCLRETGSLLMASGQADRAAQIWGAQQALIDQTGLSLDEDPSDFSEQSEAARESLGVADFERNFARGLGLSRNAACLIAAEWLQDAV